MTHYAAIDSFWVVLIITAIAGISNWLQRRAQAEQDQPPTGPHPHPSPPHPHSAPPMPPQARPAPPTARTRPRPWNMPNAPTLEPTLERELRRLFGEEMPEPTRVPREVPHTSAPPPPPVTRTIVASPQALPLGVPPVVGAAPGGPRFEAASAGLARAQQLHESVASRLHRVDEQTAKHGRQTGVAPIAHPRAAVFAIVGNREAARQAFIASLVFGVPKALEE